MADDTSVTYAAYRPGTPTASARVYEDQVTELCTALFAEFRRSDQRIRARQYLEGLLRAEGRKSIANIAAAMGVPGDGQRLHHFISSSHWAWSPVRRALADFLVEGGLPSAWVALPVSIPKAGEHTVGVSRHLSSDGREIVNGQQAYSMWYTSERLVVPVSWRLHLPEVWQRGRRRRAKAEVSEALGVTSPRDCVADLVDDVRRWGSPERPRPVVIDALKRAEPCCPAGLFDTSHPVAVRIGGHTRLAVLPWSPGIGHGRSPVPAWTLLDPTRRTRCVPRRTECHAPEGQWPLATAVVPVRTWGVTSHTTHRCPHRLMLLGVWHNLRRPPAELRLTNMNDAPVTTLVRTTRLVHSVVSGWRTRGEAIGLQDYEGRSFTGWHRHMTLSTRPTARPWRQAWRAATCEEQLPCSPAARRRRACPVCRS
ncbi:transposase [Streptomyces sp. NPDC007861]|uniref:IS701 family transposase n=1 Tax=Streptomyces sp. NPDC007861 TaxID=3154893 RepID=UPI0033C5D17D